jgi:hypothetical protein
LNLPFLTPAQEVPAGQFRAVVAPNRFRFAALFSGRLHALFDFVSERKNSTLVHIPPRMERNMNEELQSTRADIRFVIASATAT